MIYNRESVKAFLAYDTSATDRLANFCPPFENYNFISKLSQSVGRVTPHRTSPYYHYIIQFNTRPKISKSP